MLIVEQKELFPGNGDICPGFSPEGGWLIWEIQDLQSQSWPYTWPRQLWRGAHAISAGLVWPPARWDPGQSRLQALKPRQ